MSTLGSRARRVGGALAVGLVAAAGLIGATSGPASSESWPGSNGVIAFKTDRNNIWTINPDGSGAVQLTFGQNDNEEPKWSPDGTKIVFTSVLGERQQQQQSVPAAVVQDTQDIWVMDANGANPRRLVDSFDPDFPGFSENPSWSADGTHILFTRHLVGSDVSFHEQLWTINADGTNPTLLASDPTRDYSEAVYSPDGTKIAFVIDHIQSVQSDGKPNDEDPPGRGIAAQTPGSCFSEIPDYTEIWVMNANGTNKTKLTDNPGCVNENPEWSPDGAHIAFTSNRTCVPVVSDGEQCHDEVWVMDANGGTETQLTHTTQPVEGTRGAERPGWSPDGTKIVFASDANDNDSLYVMNADGSNPTLLTGSMVNNGTPNWQPVHPAPPPIPLTPVAAVVVAPAIQIQPAFTG